MNPEDLRETFAGILQSGCENCGECDDGCPCDRITEELIAAVQRHQEEALALS